MRSGGQSCAKLLMLLKSMKALAQARWRPSLRGQPECRPTVYTNRGRLQRRLVPGSTIIYVV
jgi:hypothetical protein